MKRIRIGIVVTACVVTLMLAACGNASDDQSVGSSAPEEVPAPAKTWAVLGDSLTEKNFCAATSYYDYVADDLGCAVVNYGVSGTGYKEKGGDQPFYQRVDAMELDDIDCLTIFGSFNDLGKGFPLGTADDSTDDTIGGCMNLTIQALLAKNPGLKIGIATPTPWRTLEDYEPGEDGYDHAIPQADCDAYVALLKEVAAKYRLPVLDLYGTFSLDPNNAEVRDRYYTENGTLDSYGIHPNSEGHKFMYPAWREFVKTLM